jgi:LemA protein
MMNTYLVLSLGILLVLMVYGVLTYNRLITLKHNVRLSWSNIDVLLKQRHDELPKLVEICRQYMRFEQDTLEKVMHARAAVARAQAAGDVDALGAAETQLRFGLGNLFATAEAYPELRASDKFKHLQARITGLENAIADRREFYNDTVNLNNQRIQQFPEIFLARFFNFRSHRLLTFSEEEKRDVDLRELFG